MGRREFEEVEEILNMKPAGGSEIVYANILKYVKEGYINKINLILSTCDYRLLSKDKPNVILQELSYDQQNVALMQNKQFTDAIDYFVFVSNWQMEKFKQYFNVDPAKSIVLRNAIDPIPYIPKQKTDKLKLIYTSTPWRGLNVLLKAFELLNRDDVELHIYSSVIIYGDAFAQQTQAKYEPLFQKARSMKNVVYHGYAENEEIRKAVSEAHIFSYPCIFEETSCISAIEAGMAGCYMVVTDFGALPETCGRFASYVPYSANLQELAKTYAEKLNKAVDTYWKVPNALEFQATEYYKDYSWETRAKEWEDFIEKNFSKKIIKPGEINSPEYWDGVYSNEETNPALKYVRIDPIGWKPLIDFIIPNSTILDFGCGCGDFLLELKKNKERITATGIDYSQVGLNALKKNDPTIKTYLNLNELPAESKFDYIISMHALEHFIDPVEILNKLSEFLAYNGVMVLSIPIDDMEWKEHYKIYALKDFIALLNEIDCTYRIAFREEIVKPKELTGLEHDIILKHPNGTNWKEAVAFLWFK